ncbi:hypothetical protein ACFVIL_00450 [Streptomyces sp. NPDC127159]|uniref:hypothetical protein n=1 Tax=unclassified Streptomyces TaxID=2593676 RepID=UPI00363D324C
MSVSRTTVRLFATFVASGALVAAAAMPALADNGSHGRDHGRSYSQAHRPGFLLGGHDRDRNRSRYGHHFNHGRYGNWGRHHSRNGWQRWHNDRHHHRFLGRR